VPVLQVDGGDLFGRRNKNERHQSEFLCKICGTFGIDAIGLGEQDLNFGLAFLEQMIEEHGLPFTNANVKSLGTGALILPEYLVVERGGITFGIVSVMDPAQKIITMASGGEEFEVLEPVAVLREVVPRMRDKVDTVILLGHLGDALTDQVIKEVQGIDISVTGHTYRNITTERVLDDTIMLSSAYEGRYIGKADLFIDETNGKIMAVSTKVTGLDDTIPDDPEILAKVEEYKVSLTEFKEARRSAYPRIYGSKEEDFIGDRSCKSCHEDVWQAYAKSGHMQAYNSLRVQGQHFEPDCLVCHTTGFQYENGYADDAPYNRLINVQCEACHGYGTQHARDGKWAAQAKDSCVICHDQENSPEFDYASYWDRIKH